MFSCLSCCLGTAEERTPIAAPPPALHVSPSHYPVAPVVSTRIRASPHLTQLIIQALIDLPRAISGYVMYWHSRDVLSH